MTEYRPTFILWTSFIALIPITLFLSFWAGGFFGGMLNAFVKNGDGMFGRSFVIIGGATLVLLPIVSLSLKALNYRNTVYRVFSDRIEIDEGFLTRHRKEVRLAAIREVNLRRGVLQRMTGLGSIYLATQATGQGPGWQWSSLSGGGSASASGVMMMDLGGSEAIYQEMLRRVRRAGGTGQGPAIALQGDVSSSS